MTRPMPLTARAALLASCRGQYQQIARQVLTWFAALEAQDLADENYMHWTREQCWFLVLQEEHSPTTRLNLPSPCAEEWAVDVLWKIISNHAEATLEAQYTYLLHLGVTGLADKLAQLATLREGIPHATRKE